MRRHKRLPAFKRAMASAIIAAMVLTIALPALASGAPAYRPSISVVRTMKMAKAMTIGGSISRRAAGGTIDLVVRRPGQGRWSYFATAGINRRGRWSTRYFPRVPGRYYFRAVYTANGRWSRTVNTRVKNAGVSNVYLLSTTSTQDSGLFEALVPAFQAKYPWLQIRVVAVGSGAAIQAGKDKNADVLLVHSPADEAAFIAGGWGFNRRSVMYNDYIIVGPTADPIGVAAAHPADAKEAFKHIYDHSRVLGDPLKPWQPWFLSRGDKSGTHSKEAEIWSKSGTPYSGIKRDSFAAPLTAWPDWYKRAGLGMGDLLTMASNEGAYTLTDRATYQTRKPAGLKIVTENDPSGVLYNPYSVMEVYGIANADGGGMFSDWITSWEGQSIIGRFGTIGAPAGTKPIFVPTGG